MGISNRGSGFGRVLSSESITGIGTVTAQGLTVPAFARSALVTVGSNAARFRSDGTDPTAGVGHYVAANGVLEVFGDEVGDIKFISTTGTTDLFVTYYGE